MFHKYPKPKTEMYSRLAAGLAFRALGIWVKGLGLGVLGSRVLGFRVEG